MASRVFTARYPSRPGRPHAAPQRSGATTASDVFSASDSTVARASSATPRSRASRPHRAGKRRRAPSRSPASIARATPDASVARVVPPSTVQVATVATVARAAGLLSATRCTANPATATEPAHAAVNSIPRARESAQTRSARWDAAAPKNATGCARLGSPVTASRAKPSSNPRASPDRRGISLDARDRVSGVRRRGATEPDHSAWPVVKATRSRTRTSERALGIQLLDHTFYFSCPCAISYDNIVSYLHSSLAGGDPGGSRSHGPDPATRHVFGLGGPGADPG